jgi:hypothetical protein
MIRIATLAVALSLALLMVEPAEADIGVHKVIPREGVPGTPVELSVGCGACLAVSVVRGRRHPPASFEIALIPRGRAPRPHPCGSNAECLPTPVVGRLRARPFVFLGVAKPLFTERQLTQMGARLASGSCSLATPPRCMPQYRLRFRIPMVRPGDYAIVICDCYPGPRGSLIVDAVSHRGLLRVSQGDPVTSADAASGAGKAWWIAGGAALFLLAGSAVLLRLGWRHGSALVHSDGS